MAHLAGSYTQYKVTGSLAGEFDEYLHTYSGPSGSGVSSTLQPDLDASYSLALSRLNEKLRGQIDLSIDILQAGQVKKMIRNAAKLTSYVRGFSRKTLANKWLEFTYGWKPLASTLYGSLEQVFDSTRMPRRLQAKATVKNRYSGTKRSGIWDRSQTDEVSARTAFSIDFLATMGGLDQASRLTSLNPVSIAWELVPFSFVVDWFIDIGGFVKDMETYLVASTGEISNAYSTNTSLTRSSATWTGIGKAPDGWLTLGTLTGFTEIRTLSRTLYPFWPLPRRPVFKADLGASRLLSAASLLTQWLNDVPPTRTPKKRITTEKWNRAKSKIERKFPPTRQFRKR